MLQTAIILVLIALVGADDEVTFGECKECDKSIDSCFEMVASVIKGMSPIEQENQECCAKIRVDYAYTIKRAGKSCAATGSDNAVYQSVGMMLDKIDIECEIIPIEKFAKYVGIKLPTMPTVPLLNGNIKGDKAKRIVKVYWEKPKFFLQMKLDFENDEYKVTKSELDSGDWDSMQISLKGDDLFTGLGTLITEPKLVRIAFGNIAKLIVKFAMGYVFEDKIVNEVVTMLNCGDTSDIEEEDD